MIGSDEMSSTSMDISETFRPEDLSKTDFFDFVTAPDMGIGIGVVGDRPPGSNETNGTSDQPLQGYDQVRIWIWFLGVKYDQFARITGTVSNNIIIPCRDNGKRGNCTGKIHGRRVPSNCAKEKWSCSNFHADF